MFKNIYVQKKDQKEIHQNINSDYYIWWCVYEWFFNLLTFLYFQNFQHVLLLNLMNMCYF